MRDKKLGPTDAITTRPNKANGEVLRFAKGNFLVLSLAFRGTVELSHSERQSVKKMSCFEKHGHCGVRTREVFTIRLLCNVCCLRPVTTASEIRNGQ